MFQQSGVKRKTANRQSSSLEPYTKIAHYTEMKPTLLQVLETQWEAIALPGEPLGVTHYAEHHLKLKPGSNPVYINAYKLLHSQGELLQMIKDMLEQGVIQESNSPYIFGAQKGRHISPSHRLSTS